MAGLNDFLTGTTSSATTLPSWYDTAQQNIVNQATAGAAQIPQLQNTVAGGAIQNLSGANNPFFTSQNQLSQIGTGAANPWITDASGNVKPDTSTALGGLFQAQNQQLNQLMPTTIAPAQAGAIGSGNFGSLRGQTAVDTAKANALANLQAEQMKAALQSQQTGVNAAQALGNVGAQGTSAMTTLGQAQQAAPLTAVSDLAQVLGTVKAPATVTQSQQMSPLSMIGSLGSLVGGTSGGLSSLVGSLSGGKYTSLADVISKGISALVGGAGSGLTDQQVSDMISGGGVASMTPAQLSSLLSSGQVTQAQYDRLTTAMDSGSSNTGYDSSTGYATDSNTANIDANTSLPTDTLGTISGSED